VDARGKSIVLIGMMGAGKSSVGRSLQHHAGLDLFDLDKTVAKSFNLTIPEIFEKFGEEKFREAETAALREFAPERPTIVVTGGGTILRNENVDLLKRLGFIVWLQADEGTLFERASRRGNRPLLRTENPRARMEALLAERTPLYERAADFRVDTSQMSHDEVANWILARIEEHHESGTR
jgi:shikimate kinase